MKSYKIAGVAMVASLAGVIAGCRTHSATTSASAKYGGTAVIATSPDLGPNWFFPMLPLQADTDINMQVEALMYKPLLDITPTDGIDWTKSLVSHIQTNASGTRYVLTLNRKWHWSNGHHVTAQDVVFTWHIMDGASQPTAPWGFAGAGFGGIPSRIESVSALGPYTVVFTLNKASNQVWFEHNALAQISPIPQSIWNKYPHNLDRELSYIESVANSPLNPDYQVVDGPFRPSAFVADSHWTFVKNPRYDGHQAYLNKLVFQYETQSTQEFTELKTGVVNVGYVPTALISSKSLLTQDSISQEYAFGFNFIHPNFSPQAPNGIGPVLNNLYVRQALQEGIDQPGIVQSLYHGIGVTENGPLASQPPTIYYDPALSRDGYPFDPKAGKQLLLNHGWRLVNGVMTKGKQRLEHNVRAFPFLGDSPEGVKRAVASWPPYGVFLSSLGPRHSV